LLKSIVVFDVDKEKMTLNTFITLNIQFV
jgi:hypothetical protein